MNNKTVQWINATYAILTRHNAGNIRAFGGSLKLDGKEENGAELDKTTREQIRKMLKQSWGVTDRASADEALEELLDSAKDSGSAWDYSRVEMCIRDRYDTPENIYRRPATEFVARFIAVSYTHLDVYKRQSFM